MSAAAVAPPPTLTRRQVLVVFSGLLLALLLAALDSTIVATALPTIVGELGGLERLGWVVTAYLLAQTIVTPLYGKLGDLFGRKVVLQTAIVIFLIGSALCGLSRGMMQLVLFRFIQGTGGGGLMVTSQAVVGDIVTPRERGRYQGIFGAVFGLASIAGPLLGGYFTTELSWRWIFYINLPLGILALVVIGVTLPRLGRRAERHVDLLGAGLLATSLASVILISDLGGREYEWTSPLILSMVAAAVFSLVAFVIVERRVPEPVLPLRLFSNRTFATTAAVGLVVGLSLFGSVTYLPLFLQVVNGQSPTASGLQLLPMMAGMLITSIISGQLISRWGRYKVFPLVGTLVMALGLFLMSRMDAETTVATASLNMLILGAGLGMVMQVLVIAVQNAVDYQDLGVATSGTTLFRLMGGSLGTAMFGALFAAGLSRHLVERLPAAASASRGTMTRLGPADIANLPAGVRDIYIGAFTDSLSTVFFTATFIALLAWLFSWLVPEQPLRETVAATARDVGGDTERLFPMPTDATSVARMERALSLITSRDAQRDYVARVVRTAGVELSPAAAWLLTVVDEEPSTDPVAAGRQFGIGRPRVQEALAELREKELVAAADGDHPESGHALTSSGRFVRDRLLDARREHISVALDQWATDGQDELKAALRKVGQSFDPGLQAS